MLKRSRALPLSRSLHSLSFRLMLLTALLTRSRSSVAPRTMFFLLYAGVDVVVGIGTSARRHVRLARARLRAEALRGRVLKTKLTAKVVGHKMRIMLYGYVSTRLLFAASTAVQRQQH